MPSPTVWSPCSLSASLAASDDVVGLDCSGDQIEDVFGWLATLEKVMLLRRRSKRGWREAEISRSQAIVRLRDHATINAYAASKREGGKTPRKQIRKEMLSPAGFERQ